MKVSRRISMTEGPRVSTRRRTGDSILSAVEVGKVMDLGAVLDGIRRYVDSAQDRAKSWDSPLIPPNILHAEALQKCLGDVYSALETFEDQLASTALENRTASGTN